jgi:endoglucanase
VPWDEFETFGPPAWPLRDDKGGLWDRARLKAARIDRYKPLIEKGVQIHVGEWGCINATPHSVALAWMEDCLSRWYEAGWGFAL